MKKAIAIIVLSLLWCNIANAQKSFHELIKPGMTKEQVRRYTEIGPLTFSWPLYETYEIKALGGIDSSGSAFCSWEFYSSNQYKYFPEYHTEMFTHTVGNKTHGWPWYIFVNVTKPIRCKTKGVNEGSPYKGSNGILKAVVWSKEEALLAADHTYEKKIEDEHSTETREENGEENTPEATKVINI